MRREGKEQKKNILLKQQTQFAKPLPTFAKPTAESGPDNPEWLISEDWALLQVSAGPLWPTSRRRAPLGERANRPVGLADPCRLGRPLGREAAPGATSEPRHRVPGPHAQLGPRQRRGQLLQPHLPLFQAVPEPLRERAHSEGGGQGEPLPTPLVPTGLRPPAPRSLARRVACAVPGVHPRLCLHGRHRCRPRSHTWKVPCAVRKLGPPSSLFLSFPEKVSGELESLSLAPSALPQESVGVFPAMSLPCSHRARWLPRWQDRLWTPVPPTVRGTCGTHSGQVLGVFPEKPAVAAA